MKNTKKIKRLLLAFGKIKIEAEELYETSLIAILVFIIILFGMVILFQILK
jgi:hypothetical protein